MKNISTLIVGLIICIFIGCSKDSGNFNSASTTGVGGSYARFMIVENNLYIIDDTNIRTYSLSTPATPTLVNEQEIGERIESIFHLDGKLFIGSGSGLYIYTINSNNGIPDYTSSFSYEIFPVFPCDPVVANSNYAYVTLNSSVRETGCRGGLSDV